MRLRRVAVAGLALAMSFGTARNAEARQPRPRFEPTDLELEKPGIADLDFQFGAAVGDGQGGDRLVLPDFELDLGITPRIELDIDGAFSVDHVQLPGARHLSADPLWLSMKFGLLDVHESNHAWAMGLQLGPRLPTVRSGKGIGYEALTLLGYSAGRLHTVFNAGVLIDPGDEITAGRPASVIGGVAMDLDLDAHDDWSLIGGFGTSIYWTKDPHELNFTIGASCGKVDNLDFSLVVLAGAFAETDRVAVLFGISPKFQLF